MEKNTETRKINYFEFNYYNDYGRWYGVDRYYFREIECENIKDKLKEIENVFTDKYTKLEYGKAPKKVMEDTKSVENQIHYMDAETFENATKMIGLEKRKKEKEQARKRNYDVGMGM